MGSRANLKDAFEVESTHATFYRGGQVEWLDDGTHMFCQCAGSVNILNVDDGRVTSSLNASSEDQDADLITTFTLGSDNESLVTSHKSGLLKLWKWRDGIMVKQWKSVHKGPIAQLALEGTMLASGGSDSSIRMWDLQLHTCTHNLRGISGVTSVVKFRTMPDARKNEIFAAADDSVIKSWNVSNGQQMITLSGHFSKVTAIVFHWETKYLISCGRDRVLILWDLSSQSAVRTLPAYETLEGLVLFPRNFILPNSVEITGGINVACAGENGVVRVWDMEVGRELYTQHNSLISKASEPGSLAIVNLLLNVESNSFAVVSADQNIIIHNLNSFCCKKQLIGFSDEILDLVYIGHKDSHLAVASNSADIKLYALDDMNCQLLRGHTDFVLTLANSPTNPNLLLSGSKDNSVRLWLLDAETGCISSAGAATWHTGSVGSVAFGRDFFASVSQDTCLKVWAMNLAAEDKAPVMSIKLTTIAHEKDINSVCVAPNDKLLATASQDKTAKIWLASDLSLVGVLRGHRRGVWSARFSPVDQVLLTTSADMSLKIWSLQDLSCVRTLEGHDSSVLRGEFISRGLQLVSAASDGLVKLWDLKSGECISTLDHHESRVWALAVSQDETRLMTGGSDSELVKWRDVTETKRTEKDNESEQLMMQEQELANLIHNDQMLAALKMALTLEKPLQALRIIQQVLKSGQMSGLQSTIAELRVDQKETLLKMANVWNTNSRNCYAAQLVLSVLLDDLSVGKMPLVATTIEDALPYTERHFQRLTKLLQDVHFLDYTAKCMQPIPK